MKIRQKNLLSLFVIILCLGILSCHKSHQPDIKIGFIADLSGRLSSLGNPGRDAAILAVEEVNSRGGINGCRVELIYRDNKFSESTLVRELKIMRQQGVEIVVGPMTSQMGFIAAKSPEVKDMVFISPTASTPELAGIQDNFFRIYPPSTILSKKLVDYLKKNSDVMRVGVLIDTSNAIFSLPWAESFSHGASLQGFEVLPPVFFSADDNPHFSELAGQIKQMKIDALLVVSSATDLALIAQHLVHDEVKTSIYATEWAYTDELVEYGNKAINGVRLVHTYNRYSEVQSFVDFQESFEKRFAYKPNFAAAYSYDATRIALETIEKRGRSGFQEHLQGLQEFQGLQATIQFDKSGDVKRDIFMSEVVEGRFLGIGKI